MKKKQNFIDAIIRGDSTTIPDMILNIPVRTSQKIYQKYRLNGILISNVQRGGYKKQILSNQQIEIMRICIHDDETFTLSTLKTRILLE